MSNHKEVILKFMTSKVDKTKYYYKDLCSLFPDEKPRDVKKVIDGMVMAGELVYWSSGSTTMYGLPGTGKQSAAEGE